MGEAVVALELIPTSEAYLAAILLRATLGSRDIALPSNNVLNQVETDWEWLAFDIQGEMVLLCLMGSCWGSREV